MRGRVRTLVTGGSGFIGSNLVDALVARGDEVTVLDDLSTGRRENLEGAIEAGANLIELDVRDKPAVVEAVSGAQPEAIFHLAAQIDVRRSAADPALDSRINVEGTINVLDAAREAGVRRVVNTSTGGAIYGEGKTIPAPEDHPVAPEAPYGLSKFCAEQYCLLFHRLHGLSTVSLRYGNVYGPRQDPLGEAGVIAIYCGKVLDGGRPTVFGDGLQTRDYVYVGDVVEANLLAAESDVDGRRERGHRGADHRARSGRGPVRAVRCAVRGTPRAGAPGRGAPHRPRRDPRARGARLDRAGVGARRARAHALLPALKRTLGAASGAIARRSRGRDLRTPGRNFERLGCDNVRGAPMPPSDSPCALARASRFRPGGGAIMDRSPL